jgi:hypothetical protein
MLVRAPVAHFKDWLSLAALISFARTGLIMAVAVQIMFASAQNTSSASTLQTTEAPSSSFAPTTANLVAGTAIAVTTTTIATAGSTTASGISCCQGGYGAPFVPGDATCPPAPTGALALAASQNSKGSSMPTIHVRDGRNVLLRRNVRAWERAPSTSDKD